MNKGFVAVILSVSADALADPRGCKNFRGPSPAQNWILLDEREDSINDGFFVVDMAGYPDKPGSIYLVDFPASYHNRAGGINFADGHAEIKKWLDPRTTPTLKPGQHLTLNFACPNNRDIAWLQARSTSPAR